MKNYQLLPSFVLRTPLLPFSELSDEFENIKDSSTHEEWLKKKFQQASIKEALFLASPNLYKEFEKWISGNLTEQSEVNRLTMSLMKYLIRMTYRCTPFGLFAGINIGQWTKSTAIVLKDQLSRHTRLDMHYLCEFAVKMIKESNIREQLQYFPNSTLYNIGDQLRYIEYYYKNNIRHYEISSVETDEYLERVIECAAGGASLKHWQRCWWMMKSPMRMRQNLYLI